jgi:hypothetical protein
MKHISESNGKNLGWCPNAPVLRTAPAALVVPSAVAYPVQPGGGPASPGRIRRGIGIAGGSMMAMIRNRHLFWFSFLAGLVILFLVAFEAWTVAHIGSALSFLVSIPLGESFLVFDMQLFLLQLCCFSCFTLVLAALVLYRSREGTTTPPSIRDAFDSVSPHAASLAALSVIMALAGTVTGAVVTQTRFFGTIVSGIAMTVFNLPYAYYFPNVLNSAILFSAIVMAVTAFLYLLALYVVPVMVLENKKLVPALFGSVVLMKKTWPEVLGCILVLGAVVLMVAAIALVIGQSPLLLNHDYDFFLQISRGQVLMTAACYGFVVACGALLAVGSTIMGITITDLYACGATGPLHQGPENRIPGGAEPAK